MTQRNELDYHDMSFEQALSLGILILEYYLDRELPKDRHMTNMGRYEFSVTIRNVIIEYRQRLNWISQHDIDRIADIYRLSTRKKANDHLLKST